MSGVAAAIALPLAVLATVWLVLCPVVWLVHRLTGSALARWAPRDRATLLLALALLPPLGAALVVILGFAPAIGGLVVDPHCHAATGCGAHVPVLQTDALYVTALTAGTIAAAGGFLWPLGMRLRRSLRLAGTLGAFAERGERRGYEVIPSREPFAYCFGLLRPRIAISAGLLEKLSASEVDAVLRHEEAHAKRHDNLRHWAAAAALAPLPRRLRAPLLGDLTLAAELACDVEAARFTTPEAVTAALRALASAPAARAAQRTPATRDAVRTLATRIAALRAPAQARPRAAGTVPIAIALAYVACATAATVVAHHAAEHALAWLP